MKSCTAERKHHGVFLTRLHNCSRPAKRRYRTAWSSPSEPSAVLIDEHLEASQHLDVVSGALTSRRSM